MVSRILISIALLFSSVAFSQEESALKFNQVLLIELTEDEIVVPEGKVWKVVSAVSQLPGDGEYSVYNEKSYFFINGLMCDINRYTYNNPSRPASTAGSNIIFPMWLPSGTSVSSGDKVSALSIIEFNTD